MYISLWDWFDSSIREARRKGNPDIERLPQLYYEGMYYKRNANYANSLASYEQGAALARQLKQPCWELFFEYWATEIFIFHANDYGEGLDRAVKNAARAYKEGYKACPVRARVVITLIYTYVHLDPIGYEDKIREMLDFLINDIPMDDDTHMRAQYIRAELEYDKDEYDKSEQELMLYMDMIYGRDLRLASGYSMWRALAYARGDIRSAFDYAFQQEDYAYKASSQQSYAVALLWQAVYSLLTDQRERAERFHQRAEAHYTQHNLPMHSEYYDAMCAYHEHIGDIQRAIVLREDHIASAPDVGSPNYTIHAPLTTCSNQRSTKRK